MLRTPTLVGIMLALLNLGARVEAAPPPYWPAAPSLDAADSAPTADTRRIVLEISSDDYKTRERAQSEVAEQGVEAFPGLAAEVDKSRDPEVHRRLDPLLKNHLAAPKIFTARLRQLLQSYENTKVKWADIEPASSRVYVQTEALRSSNAMYEAGDPLFRFLGGQEKNPEILAALEKLRIDRAPTNARLAIADGDPDRAQKILREGLTNNGIACSDYVALLALRQGPAFDAKKELADLQPDTLRYAMPDCARLLFDRASGDYRSAARYTRSQVLHDGSFAIGVFLEARDYQGIADVWQSIKPLFPPKRYCPEALAWRLTGHPEKADAVLAAVAAGQASGPLDSDWTTTLLQNGKVQECIDAIHAHGDDSDAAAILAYQLRLREALQLKPQDSTKAAGVFIALGLTRCAQRVLLENKPDLVADPHLAAMKAVVYCAKLRAVGLSKEADQFEDIIFDIIKRPGPHYNFDTQLLFRNYDEYYEARFWLESEAPSFNQEAFNRARDIVNGRLKPQVTMEQFPAFLGWVYDQWTLATAFHALDRVGETPMAFQLVAAWCARENDPTGFTILGDWALDHNQPKAAVAFYLKAAPLNRTDPTLMYRTGFALGKDSATSKDGESLMHYSEMLVLGDRGLSNRLAKTIRKYQGDQLADEYIDRHDSRFGLPDQDYAINERIARARRAAESRGDYAEALACQTEALFRPDQALVRGGSREVLMLANVAHYHRLRALDAFSRKDFPAVADALQCTLNVGPPDVQLLEHTLPALEKVDAVAARRILQEAIDRLTPVVADYPEATRYEDQLDRLKRIED